MFELIEKDRKSSLNGYDYIVDNLKKLERIRRTCSMRRLDGELWQVAVVSLLPKDIFKLLEDDYGNNAVIHIIVNKDTYRIITDEKPELRKPEKSRREVFSELIKEYPILLDTRAYFELFNRCGTDAVKIDEVMNSIQEVYPESEKVTVQMLNSVVLPDTIIYASDVVTAMLVKFNELIPARGHRLSRYKTSNPMEMYTTLCNRIGEHVAGLAVRKYALKLYQAKMGMLNNEKENEIQILEYVDILELVFIINYLRKDNPQAVYSLISLLKERREQC